MRIFRYLASDVLTHTLAVAVVLFVVVFSGRFIRYLAEAAVGDITAEILLPVMLYRLPSFFELILPLSLFIGILLAFGRLYADSEMVVLRACGISPAKLARLALIPALFIASLVALLSLQVAPDGSARARLLLETPRAAENLQVLASGRFKKQRAGRLVSYAETIDDRGVMHNVFVAERKPDDLQMTVTLAQSGEIIIDPETGRRYLELRNGSRHRGHPGAADYEVVSFAQFGELIPEEEGSVRSTPRIESVPTKELLNRSDTKAKAALWWRVSLPLLVPIVAIIAVALSKTDARRGRYARIGPALVIFLVYFIALTQSRSLIEADGGAWPMVATHLAFACLAGLLLFWEDLSNRARGVRRG